jgi:U3 small nucleolar ribonucleoprotein component
MKSLIPIQVIYPSREFQVEQSNAVESQQSLRDEAEEHYQLLKALSQSDMEYQRQLKQNYERKSEVKRALEKGSSWPYIVKQLSQR